MAKTERIEKVFKDLGRFIEARLMRELLSQGHKATGALVSSIQLKVLVRLDEIILEESHLSYGRFVETGRKPGGKKVPIAALEQWIKNKQFNIAADRVKGVAFAIQTNIFKFGIPTDKDPRKKGFLAKTLVKVEGRITDEANKAADQQIDILIEDLVNETQKKFVV